MSADSAAELFELSSRSRRDLLAAFSSGKAGSGNSSTTELGSSSISTTERTEGTELGSSSIDSTTPYSLLRGYGSRE